MEIEQTHAWKGKNELEGLRVVVSLHFNIHDRRPASPAAVDRPSPPPSIPKRDPNAQVAAIRNSQKRPANLQET